MSVSLKEDNTYSRYVEYLQTGELSDVAFRCPREPDDGHYVLFRLHRVIVMSRSVTLASLLNSAPSEQVFQLETPAPVFQALVWAMYTDALNGMPESDWARIAWAAHYYQVKSALFWATQFVRHSLTADSAVSLANQLLAAKDGTEHMSAKRMPIPLTVIIEYIHKSVTETRTILPQLDSLHPDIQGMIDAQLLFVNKPERKA